MATAASHPAKKVAHPYDPLDDLPWEVVEMGQHTPFINHTDQANQTLRFWADWAVQTIDLHAISDRLESHDLPRHFTISAVLFRPSGDDLLLTLPTDDRVLVPVADVQHDNVQTTRPTPTN